MQEDRLQRWARDEVGGARLADERRTKRLVAMVATAARSDQGRVSSVFQVPAERQAAYDFLEHKAVSVDRVCDAIAEAAVRRCAAFRWVYVILDGTSLTLTDSAKKKDFGSIGCSKHGARGLKVLNTLALDPKGVPIGTPAQIWWARTHRAKKGYRPLHARESQHWGKAVSAVEDRLQRFAHGTRMHVLADREGDASALLLQLIDAGHDFTIRSNATRKLWIGDEGHELRPTLERRRPVGVMHVDVRGNSRRTARRARLVVRACRQFVVLRDHHTQKRRVVKMSIVWAREERTCPAGEKPLDWVLYTSDVVRKAADAHRVVQTYTLRWRIEDFHKTWKSGHCNVEEAQLRSRDAVIKWATIQAAVAARIERLRHRARETPEEPANVELADVEIEALLLLKHREKKRTETVPKDTVPTIVQAVRWLADLGGYVGNRSSGPPGAITIARGLERVTAASEIIAELRTMGKLR